MVQEKNAALKREAARKLFREERALELARNTIGFRWAVNEHTPGYNSGGYYDMDVPSKNHTVSPYFDTEEQANEWMDEHEPDEGKSLNIIRQRLVKREYTEWVNY